MTVALHILETGPVRPLFAQGPRSLEMVKLLRVSVTDRCNLRCMYCMPEEGMAFSPKSDCLSASELIEVAAAAVGVGINHLKITGGEPTVRQDLLRIVQGFADLNPTDLSMTTNAMTLDRQASDLRNAGLDRLTISWDSAHPARLARIAGAVKVTEPQQLAHERGNVLLERLHRGIDAAMDAGFDRLKFNMVVINGINDDEVVDFARRTIENNWTIRFIEYMPLGDSQLTTIDNGEAATLETQTVKARIEKTLGPLEPADKDTEAGVGPAAIYRFKGAAGRLGFISAMSQPFCETCNRLRLTAAGELRACLFDGEEVSVLPALRPKVQTASLVDLMKKCVSQKPETHSNHGNRAMSQLGG